MYSSRPKWLLPAISFIGTADQFYAETKDYFNNHKEAGIKTSFKEFDGGYHAFDMMVPLAEISKSAYDFLIKEYMRFTFEFIINNNE